MARSELFVIYCNKDLQTRIANVYTNYTYEMMTLASYAGDLSIAMIIQSGSAINTQIS